MHSELCHLTEAAYDAQALFTYVSDFSNTRKLVGEIRTLSKRNLSFMREFKGENAGDHGTRSVPSARQAPLQERLVLLAG